MLEDVVQKEEDEVDRDGGVWEGDGGGEGVCDGSGDSGLRGGGGGNGDRGGDEDVRMGVMEAWRCKRMEVNGIGEVVP